VTYPDPAVSSITDEYFAACRVNTKDEASKALIEQCRQVWTPDFRILGPDGFDYEQWNGFLPPGEFAPKLLTGAGNAWLRMKSFERSIVLYEQLLTRYPASDAAPEAAYYLAVARNKVSGDREQLRSGFRRLRDRYPTSIWREKQRYIEEE
jgi:tetratricopeptide (TPR) repeat protein